MKNEKKHGRSAKRGNMPSPYTKFKKKPYFYDMAEIDRNRIKAKELGLHYVYYMNGRRAKVEEAIRLKEAA